MGLLSETIEVGLVGTNIKLFKDKGYIIPDVITKKTKIIVNVNDLSPNSTALVLVECDICKKKRFVKYGYYNNINHNGKYKTLTGRGVLFMIVLIVYLGVTTEGTDNWGHIGGLITGFLLCVILYRKPSNKELQESKNIDFTYENQYTDSNE